MKQYPVGSRLEMNISSRVPGDKPIMAIIYKYRSQKVLGFIDEEGSGITKLDVTYFYCYPEIYNVLFSMFFVLVLLAGISRPVVQDTSATVCVILT